MCHVQFVIDVLYVYFVYLHLEFGNQRRMVSESSNENKVVTLTLLESECKE